MKPSQTGTKHIVNNQLTCDKTCFQKGLNTSLRLHFSVHLNFTLLFYAKKSFYLSFLNKKLFLALP